MRARVIPKLVAALCLAAALTAPAAHAEDVVTVAVGQRPVAVAVNSGTGTVYVAARNAVAVVSGNVVVATVPLGGPLSDIAVDERTGRVYAANAVAGTVTVLDGDNSAVLGVIAAGPGMSTVDVDEEANAVYATGGPDGSVAVLDGVSNTLRETLPGEAGPLAGVRVDSGRQVAYFTGDQSKTVEVLDTAAASFVASVPVGKAPAGLDLHEERNKVYVANSGIHHLSVLDGETRTEEAEILLPSAASSVAVHQGSGTVYTNGGPNGLARIDGSANEVTGELALGTNAGDVAVDQHTGTVYVLDPRQDALLAITGF
ncbi:YncE family protein [Amycolatopsis magusensis]|uniref:YncE family protein n=1 Tax=Amycolatopsis magusensis TaxID=882444 RepID=UPI0024A9DDAB|nr:YncE family protein [Amycolatopsis magusensis]MDI5977773.1 YncE family protein [Amycolatopsis magusensis]